MAQITFSPSLNGYVTNFIHPSTTTWVIIRDATSGTSANSTNTTMECVRLRFSASGANGWSIMSRSFILFDTSALGVNAVITSATLRLYGQLSHAGNITPEQAVGIYTTTPASDSALVAGDYDQVGTTAQSDTMINCSSWSTSGYNEFALNAAGLASINKTGITKFGTRGSGDATNTEPSTTGGADENNADSYTTAETGTSKDPELVVNYTVGGSNAAFLLKMI